ncbi:MAG: LptF/LptG family permease [Elusimicrobiota bacterium]|jgi:lipopolysaccharide export system permease protein
MRLLTRYLLRSYFPAFLMALGAFLFILLMQYFLRLFNLAVMKGISLLWIMACFARLLPYFLSLALPMAFLVALLLTLGHLSETGEVLAMRASGWSFSEILAPFLTAALALSGLLFYVNHKASPDGFHSFRNAYVQAADRVARVDIEPRTFFPLGDWRFYAEEVGRDGEVSGVRLVKLKGQYARLRVSAKDGKAVIEHGRGVSLELHSGSLQWPNEDPGSLTTATFGRYRLFVPFVDPQKAQRDPDIPELDTFSLLERVHSDKIELSKRREYATEAALRSAGAAAPFALFWVACPLGLRLERRSRAIGFALSLLVMFVFYGLLALGVGIGRRDMELSFWAPWLPHAAALLAALPLWFRLRRA